MMLMSVPTVSNDWKYHGASHFDHPEVKNTMVLLMMQSLSCDTNTGMTWPKRACYTCLNHLDLANKRVPLTMLSLSCDACIGASNITGPRVIATPCFSCFFPNEQNDTIHNAVSITWQQSWYYWNQRTEK